MLNDDDVGTCLMGAAAVLRGRTEERAAAGLVGVKVRIKALEDCGVIGLWLRTKRLPGGPPSSAAAASSRLPEAAADLGEEVRFNDVAMGAASDVEAGGDWLSMLRAQRRLE